LFTPFVVVAVLSVLVVDAIAVAVVVVVVVLLPSELFKRYQEKIKIK
jgi:hypothetical protein